MAKICNQLFVKDIFRDRKYRATVKCVCCNEESNLDAPLPFEMKLMSDFCSDFVKLHKRKGCNKVVLPTPDWASTEVNLGIAF